MSNQHQNVDLSFKEFSFFRDSYYRWKNKINKALMDFLQTAYFHISKQVAKGEIDYLVRTLFCGYWNV